MSGRKDKFPLWLHSSGQWCRKHRGRFYYFGTDRDAALKRYVAEWPAILEGRAPKRAPGDLTVVALVNSFLTAKRDRVDSGELTLPAWGDYHAMAARVLDVLGRDQLVSDLRPADFGKLRATVAKKYGPATLSKFLTMARSMFGFAFNSGLIPAPVKYGDQFDKPPKRILRLDRARKGLRLAPPATIWKLLDRAEPQLRAMILLAMNGGLGQTDCANLERRHLDPRGWVNFPRKKTGIGRRFPLWPETLDALAEVAKVRPAPLDPADGDRVFLTRHGRPWVRYLDAGGGRRGSMPDAVGQMFARLVKACGVEFPGGFYTFRHVFRTVADEVKDRAAIDLVMGHADDSMAGYYRELVSEERLRAVVAHVRAWLLAGRE